MTSGFLGIAPNTGGSVAPKQNGLTGANNPSGLKIQSQ